MLEMCEPSPKDKLVSGHWDKEGKAIIPSASQDSLDAKTDEYVTTGIYNRQYEGGIPEFFACADAYKVYGASEQQLLEYIEHKLNDPTSAENKQASHILHLARGWFAENKSLQIAPEILASPEANLLIKKFKQSLQMSLPLAEMSHAVEVIVTSLYMLPTEERKLISADKIRAGSTKDPDSGGFSHQRRSKFGINLLHDIGTRVQEILGLPTMSGTSGTTSEIILTLIYIIKAIDTQEDSKGDSKNIGLKSNSIFSPELTDIEGGIALAHLMFIYMRRGALPDYIKQKTIANLLNQHPDKKIIEKGNNPENIQTHSYAEIVTAIYLTLHEQPKPLHPEVYFVAGNLLSAQLAKVELIWMGYLHQKLEKEESRLPALNQNELAKLETLFTDEIKTRIDIMENFWKDLVPDKPAEIARSWEEMLKTSGWPSTAWGKETAKDLYQSVLKKLPPKVQAALKKLPF